MRVIKQVFVLSFFGMKSLPARWGSSVVIVTSIAGVVAVLLGVMTMSASLLRTMGGASQPDRAIVLSKESRSEGGSNLPREDALTIQSAPGLRTSNEGKSIASPEVLVMVTARQKVTESRAEIMLRGMTAIGFTLRSEIKLIAGRRTQPGIHELIVGRAAQSQYKSLELGDTITIRGTKWNVVGVFEANGSARESELIADAETVLSAFQRNSFQSITAQLDSPASFTKFKDALTSNPSLSVDVMREAEYYRLQTDLLNKLLSIIAYIVGGIMAIGAMAGAINCMYSAVSDRGVEIATLRALGFGSFSVVVSVLIESLLLALLGTIIGSTIVWLVLQGATFSTRLSDGQVISQLHISSHLIAVGVIWACTIGMIGGFFPAFKASRIPIAAALRGI